VFGDYSAIRKDYLIGDFLADIKNQNVVKTVHLQVEYDHNDPVAETRWLQSVADEHGYPHGIVGFADLASPNAQAVIEEHCQYKNVRGIRQCLNFHRDPVKTFIDSPHLMSDPQWRRGYALLKQHGLSFDLQLYYTQMEEALALARDFPDTPMVLNHTGMPVDRKPEEIEAWEKSMTLLASADNVLCKISGLGMGDWKWTVDSIRPFVLHAIEAFGVERCMFASNFPVDQLFSSYDDVFNAFKEITRHFSAHERAALFHDNAERVYRL
jgi:predicted TIM-barrel fold metal-dependent hydrolase